MIESSIITRLKTDPAITTAVGSKIYLRRAPTTSTLPWIIVTNSGGMPKQLSMVSSKLSHGTEKQDILTLYVDANDPYTARDIAAMVEHNLHNYRGDLSSVYDTLLRVGSSRDLDGYNGVFRELVTVYARFTIPTNVPPV